MLEYRLIAPTTIIIEKGRYSTVGIKYSAGQQVYGAVGKVRGRLQQVVAVLYLRRELNKHVNGKSSLMEIVSKVREMDFAFDWTRKEL